MNVQLVLSGLFSFFWGGFITPLSIRLAQHYQIMDIPDYRKIHKAQTPRGAGLGLWAGYLLWALYTVSDDPSIRYSATGATLVFLCGYLDDMKSLSPFVRLAVHFLAAALVVVPLGLPFPTALICFVWITGTTSAYNLIDGVNGLCISLFIASSIALFFVGAPGFSVVMSAMALGVLCWNFPLAQTFLGDGGSTLLGFLFSAHFIIAGAPTLTRAGLLWLLLLLLLFGGIPVFDTLVAFSRRIMMGKSPFYPDRGHLHHLLVDLTGSAYYAAPCLCLFQVLFLFGGISLFIRFS